MKPQGTLSPDYRETDTFLLHPQGETFGPFDLAFVRETLAKGGIAPTTGLTLIRDGVEHKWRSVGDLWPEPRQWTISCAECQLSHVVNVTEAITMYGQGDYRRQHLAEFVRIRCPKLRKIDECGGQYNKENRELGRARRP